MTSPQKSNDSLKALGLTLKQQDFVRAYCRPDMHYNATRAYCEAYGVCYHSGYRTAQVNASRLLSKTIIQRAVDLERARILEKHDTLAEVILAEWVLIAQVNITEVIEINGQTVSLKELADIPPHLRACIKSLKTTAHGIDITMHDKSRALENIAKALGMFTKVVQNISDDYEQLVSRIDQERQAEKDK